MIRFHSEEVKNAFTQRRLLSSWLKEIAANYGRKIGEINYILCSDEYLLAMNQQYLDHDTYTDIITFDYSEGDIVSGDVYISLPRIQENATHYGVNEVNELHRVIAHGLLHLCGLKDKSPSDQKKMKSAENQSLDTRPAMLLK